MAEPVLTLAGGYIATTAQLVRLINLADEEGLEHAPVDLLSRLDPKGQHLLCHQMTAPDGVESKMTEDGRSMFEFEVSLGDVVPCQLLAKVRNRKAPVEVLMSVRIVDLVRLEEAVDRRTLKIKTWDGQHR